MSKTKKSVNFSIIIIIIISHSIIHCPISFFFCRSNPTLQTHIAEIFTPKK